MNSRMAIQKGIKEDLIHLTVLDQNQGHKAYLILFKEDSNGHQIRRENFRVQVKGNSNSLISREINPDLLEGKRDAIFRMVTQIQEDQTDSRCRRLEDFILRKADNFHQPQTVAHLNLPKADNFNHHQAGFHSLLPEAIDFNPLRAVVQEIFRLLQTVDHFHSLLPLAEVLVPPLRHPEVREDFNLPQAVAHFNLRLAKVSVPRLPPREVQEDSHLPHLNQSIRRLNIISLRAFSIFSSEIIKSNNHPQHRGVVV